MVFKMQCDALSVPLRTILGISNKQIVKIVISLSGHDVNDPFFAHMIKK